MKKKLQKLKELRKANDIKQREMAELLGISKPAYNQKENGKRAFTIDECRIVAELFSETIEGIFFASQVNANKTG